MDQANELDDSLLINAQVRIPRTDLTYRFARSSGPGGQHVNKAETAVELLFDLANTPHLSVDQRARAQQRLVSYLDGEGVIHLVAQSERSQLRNREEVTRRFTQLLQQALAPVKKRRATKPSRAAHERRLDHKRRVGAIKRARQRQSTDE